MIPGRPEVYTAGCTRDSISVIDPNPTPRDRARASQFRVRPLSKGGEPGVRASAPDSPKDWVAPAEVFPTIPECLEGDVHSAALIRHARTLRFPFSLLDSARRGRSTSRSRLNDARLEGIDLPLSKRLVAECLGTFWLVFAGCGSAVLTAAFPKLGIGILGVALAFGLTVLTMAFAIGHISGCHLNPAVSVGLATARRFPWRDVPAYVIAQVVGALIASGVLYVIASGAPAGLDLNGGFATNGFGERSPGGYSLEACLIAEVVMTFMFLITILGATDERAPAGFAPIAIGLMLTLIHLVIIPITNCSVNPARSTGPAFVVGGGALNQLWLFWLAPILGALLAGVVYPLMAGVKAGGASQSESAA